MRSRYAAFALGLGDYLFDTLARTHEDSALPRDEAARELSRVRERRRFLGLSILHAEADEVLFFARVFERGEDCSFAELSTFVREDGKWRYAHGIDVPRARLPEDPTKLTRTAFLTIADANA